MVQLVCCTVASTADGITPAMRLHEWRMIDEWRGHGHGDAARMSFTVASWARREQGLDGGRVARLRARREHEESEEREGELGEGERGPARPDL
jgi:hypothetical protein